MYADFRVEIPREKGKITRKRIKGTTYIYYQLKREYDADKKYIVPKSTPIGKACDDTPDMMIPNEKYMMYFPEADLPEEKKIPHRSSCLRVGAYMVLRKIIAECHLDELLGDVIGDESGLFLDIAVYTIITENNAGQYYPDYAYNHPLFTDRMKIYSDAKVSMFINGIRSMDRCGYDFMIMMKGKKDLVKDLVMKKKGTFEENRKCSIRDYKVSGITVEQKLFATDEKVRYFHIYYNGKKQNSEREKLEERIDQIAEVLAEKAGTAGYECPRAICHYFDPIYHTKDKIRHFVCAREKSDVVSREIALCGYFVIITSEKMTAAEALELYKSRGDSEKLFRGDKSYLGNRSLRVHSSESVTNKIFIEFVALIIRNRFYTLLKEQEMKNKKKENYMAVPAALRELEKIEMTRQSDGNYRMDYAVTKTQKEILKSFDMTERNIRNQAVGINREPMTLQPS